MARCLLWKTSSGPHVGHKKFRLNVQVTVQKLVILLIQKSAWVYVSSCFHQLDPGKDLPLNFAWKKLVMQCKKMKKYYHKIYLLSLQRSRDFCAVLNALLCIFITNLIVWGEKNSIYDIFYEICLITLLPLMRR